MLPSFLKPPLDSKPGHHGIEDEPTDGSALSFGSNSDLLRFFPCAVDEKCRPVAWQFRSILHSY